MNATRGSATAALAMVFAVFAPERSWALTCGFTISNMSFGSEVDTLSGSVIDTTATLQYNCSGGTPSARVLICAGLGDGSVAPSGSMRRMIEGGDSTLLYQMYRNPERTSIWGSFGSANPPPPIAVDLDGNGAAATGDRTIFGRISSGQTSARPTTYGSSFAGSDVDIRYRETDDSECATGLGTSGGAVSFSVDATVTPMCKVDTDAVNFGTQGTLQVNIDATGAVLVTCTPETGYSIRLDGGEAAAAPTARLMSRGERTITYGLYRDSERSLPWGDTGGTTAAGTGTGSTQSHTVFGRVGPQATPPPGNYTDTVIVVVDY
jgi:spore coat protein U-like protein